MGNKQSIKKSSDSSANALHPQEKRRLTHFLKEKKGSAKFTYPEVQRLWCDVLTPDLLDSYTNFLFKPSQGQRRDISLNEFISIYVNLIRGGPDEKTKVIAAIIGSKKNSKGMEVISYQDLCKYLSDLLESYFVGLEHHSDTCYKSWMIHTDKPKRTAIEEVIQGVCNDLLRTDDEIRLDLFEKWLHQCAIVNLLHSYVLGSLYNLSPELESTMIPFAQLPMKKLNHKMSMLDVSHVLYLNSFLPTENKEVWRFLYSVDVHGESYSKFTACIVNQGPILIVVRTNSNKTFGGFISTNVAFSPKWIGSDSCFLFRLGSSVDVYPATGYNDHYAYLNTSQSTLPNGLGMGGQYGYWGLWIDSHFGDGECSESCATYRNYKMLDTNKKFHIKGLEVWGVGEPPPSDEERGVRSSSGRGARSGRSALDQDPTSAQILEMAGREMHSKGFRDSMSS